MTEEHVFPVRPDIARSAWCDNDRYLTMYKQSIEHPVAFWGEHGKRIDWFQPYKEVKDVSFKAPDVQVRQRSETGGRQEGRPGDDLSADDPRAADHHAGVHPDRRHPLHRLRRLL